VVEMHQILDREQGIDAEDVGGEDSVYWGGEGPRPVGLSRPGAGSMPARFQDRPHRAGRPLIAESDEVTL
jgi:hypothetical protein